MCLYAHVSVHTCVYTDAHAQRLEEDFGWPVDCSLTFCLHLLSQFLLKPRTRQRPAITREPRVSVPSSTMLGAQIPLYVDTRIWTQVFMLMKQHLLPAKLLHPFWVSTTRRVSGTLSSFSHEGRHLFLILLPIHTWLLDFSLALPLFEVTVSFLA